MEGPNEELDLRESRESLLHCVQIFCMLGVKFKKVTEDCLKKGILKNGINFYSEIIPELVEYTDWARDLANHSKIYINWMEKYGESIVRGREDAISLLDAAKKYYDEFFQKEFFAESSATDLLSRALTLHGVATNNLGFYEVDSRKTPLDGYVAGTVWRNNGIEVDCCISSSAIKVMVEAARMGPGAVVETVYDSPKNVQTDIRKAHELIEKATAKKLNWHVKACGNDTVKVCPGPFPPKKAKDKTNS